ncbi:MAG: hypothetical protein LBJ23_01410, partial [Tannerella sp.]|nr:hypothetical protein [Tannerella sp.]
SINPASRSAGFASPGINFDSRSAAFDTKSAAFDARHTKSDSFNTGRENLLVGFAGTFMPARNDAFETDPCFFRNRSVLLMGTSKNPDFCVTLRR